MLRSHEPVPARALLAIELYFGDQSVVVLGEVRHCTETVGAFKLGIKLQFTGPWAKIP
jgi:hypothetical protein